MNAKSKYRIGKREGQDEWLIKQAPGWKIAARSASLSGAAIWLESQGVDISTVFVVSCLPGFTPGEWPTLAQALASKSVLSAQSVVASS